MSLSSAGMGLALALIQSGWTMLAVLQVIHAFSPVQAGELGSTTVAILKMWPFPVLVPVVLPETADLLPRLFYRPQV